MFKTLLQNNCSSISNFKINAIKKSIKFETKLFKSESISLIFNNNKIINVINMNFNELELDVFHLKIYKIKKLIVNSHLIFLSIRYNVFKNFKTLSLNLIILFQFKNSFASLLNIRILNSIMIIVKIKKNFFINLRSNCVIIEINILKNLTRLFTS